MLQVNMIFEEFEPDWRLPSKALTGWIWSCLYFSSLYWGKPVLGWWSSALNRDIIMTSYNRCWMCCLLFQFRRSWHINKCYISYNITEKDWTLWFDVRFHFLRGRPHETENCEHPPDFILNWLFSLRSCCRWQISQYSLIMESISFSSWIDLKSCGAWWWSDGVSRFVDWGFTSFRLK